MSKPSNTIIKLPDGKTIEITSTADKRTVKMVNDVLHKMDAEERKGAIQ